LAIVDRHIPFYREIFAIPGFLAEPLLTIGFQAIIGEDLPDEFRYEHAKQLLRARGITDVTAIDLFDERADLRYDLNLPVPSREEERYRTVCDIGTLEHLFDTKQCMENCMRMVSPGGHYFLCTPVRGYYRHGFHTFDPELIIGAFRLNGFDIEYLKYSTGRGVPVEELEQVPAGLPDEHAQVPTLGPAQRCLIWIVGKKTASLEAFRIPQQGMWASHYSPT
jgi:hypothetical protein